VDALASSPPARLVALDEEDVPISARKGKVIVRSGKGDRFREVPLHAEPRPIVQA
jgi:hypothetical protein